MASFTIEDQMFATLMAYREAANQGDAGINAVLWVAKNNALKYNRSIYSEVTFPFRYSSMVAPIKLRPAGDPKYSSQAYIQQAQEIINAEGKYAKQGTADWNVWEHINDLVIAVLSGETPDLTSGATLYYSVLMIPNGPPADWDQSKIVFTCQIGNQKFYREIN